MVQRSKSRAQNKNSRIETEWTGNTGRRSRTSRRDDGTLTALVDTTSNNSTNFVIRKGDIKIRFTGHEARTLLQLLAKHYEDSTFYG